MLLGASGESIDLHAVMEGAGVASGLPAGEALTALAEATVTGDDAAIRASGERVQAELGEAALVDAAAVIGNFERMVRIADGTGIPLDAPISLISADLRQELGIDAFGGADGTEEVRGVKRWVGRGLSKALPLLLRLLRNRGASRAR